VKAVVVIPIHSSNPNSFEQLSFKRCFEVLNKHQIFILAPKVLCLKKYEEIVSNFQVVRINPKWQSNIIQYNKLKRSLFFYNLFKKYDYLLTYELDAYVFKDDLDKWMISKNDYIGAPWFEGYATPISNKIIGVGNSGFSLRSISKCIYVLEKVKKMRTIFLVTKFLKLNKFIPYKYFLKGISLKNTKKIDLLFSSGYINEDIYWCNIVSTFFEDFTIASFKESIQFSFEVNPQYLYKVNNNELPFGCHAWQKYEPEFWIEFIPKK
jgi:hypothetical protein